ncbi:hypothetical protein CBW58_02115 [Yersinia frederiksenii]|nr:hypothetical protein CBW58_02115 [Yersinia frederiksenii]
MSGFIKKMTAERFNAVFPYGSAFIWHSRKDGAGVAVTSRSEAWELGHGAVVVAVTGVSGGVDITHLKPANN